MFPSGCEIFASQVAEDSLLVGGHGLPPTALSLDYDKAGPPDVLSCMGLTKVVIVL